MDAREARARNTRTMLSVTLGPSVMPWVRRVQLAWGEAAETAVSDVTNAVRGAKIWRRSRAAHGALTS